MTRDEAKRALRLWLDAHDADSVQCGCEDHCYNYEMVDAAWGDLEYGYATVADVRSKHWYVDDNLDEWVEKL